jgi:hypothetical protein
MHLVGRMIVKANQTRKLPLKLRRCCLLHLHLVSQLHVAAIASGDSLMSPRHVVMSG